MIFKKMDSIENKQQLPNATAVLVLGILSLVFCWCYGFVGLVLGIIAVVLASAPLKVYRENPDAYTEVSYKNLKAGRICGIIGIVMAVFVVLMMCLFFFTLREVDLSSGAWSMN